jgi:hypothetical protein
MQHILCREIEARRDLGPARRFLMPLFLYDLMTRQPQLNTCHGVNDVCDTHQNHTE